MNPNRYTEIPRSGPKIIFEEPRNPWPDRILIGSCLVIIGIGGALITAAFFGFFDK